MGFRQALPPRLAESFDNWMQQADGTQNQDADFIADSDEEEMIQASPPGQSTLELSPTQPYSPALRAFSMRVRADPYGAAQGLQKQQPEEPAPAQGQGPQTTR